MSYVMQHALMFARAQAIIKKESQDGYRNNYCRRHGHAEVNGLLGYSDGEGFVVEDIDDVEKLPYMDKACVVAQTTQDRTLFQAVIEKILKKISDVRIFGYYL